MSAFTAAADVGVAGIYTTGRIATNALTITQAFLTAAAQLKTTEWMINKQQSMWDHVAAKQIQTVEVALNEFVMHVSNLLPLFQAAYPDVPVAARLPAVDPQEVQFNQMVDNLKNMPKSAEYMLAANHWHRINWTARAEFLSPGFGLAFYRHMQQINSLLDGQLPIDEAVGVVSDSAELAAMNGRIGNTSKVTAASMGIRRLQVQALGRDELARRITMMQGIAPVESEVLLNSLMHTPDQRLRFAMEYAQLLQNDLQNVNNAAAQKAPYLMAQLQTMLQTTVMRLQFNANKANMQNQFVPNFPALFGPTVTNLSNQIAGAFRWEKDGDSSYLSGNQHVPAASSSGGIF